MGIGLKNLYRLKYLGELDKLREGLYHDLPMSSYHLHGYFNDNPMFFEQLVVANNYEILFHWFSANEIPSLKASFEMKAAGYPDDGWIEREIEFVLRKTPDEPFKLPLDTTTSLGLNTEIFSSEGNHYCYSNKGRFLEELITQKFDLRCFSGRDFSKS